MKRTMKRKLLASAVSVMFVAAMQSPALAGDINQPEPRGASISQETKQQGDGQYKDQKLKDAWIHGKVELALTMNPHLNPFEINTQVEHGVVRLSGEVESAIDRDLATEVTRSVNDVLDVKNDLMINPAASQEKAGKLTQLGRLGNALDDASITTKVKSKLLANTNTHGLKIDVTTENNAVFLAGEVQTAEERDLAGLIARNTSGVELVENNLIVKTQDSDS